jgi:hypothetical protein
MHCANPECGRVADDLTIGVLRLIELDVPPEQRITRSDSGFPICAVRSRYFWLCEQCCEILRIRRWTENELIFEYRKIDSKSRKTAQEIALPVTSTARGPQLLRRRA